MDHAAKAKFILALHKHSLQAFDSGGTVLGDPGSSGNTYNNNDLGTGGFAGTVGNVLGISNQFQAGPAQIQGGTNRGQLNNAYADVQGGLNGQREFANQAGAQGGFGNQNVVFGQQQALSNQLQAQSRGEGPNLAQEQLNQATAQNVANQGALMAGQRGAGANAGLIARQAGQQGAATQQQAAGQSGVMRAQQQLAAQSALANQQAQMQSVASNQIAAQGQGASNYSQALQNEQNILQGANTAYNNAATSMQGNINNVNAQTAASNQNANQNIIGGIGSMLSNIPSIPGMAQGGMVHGRQSTMPAHMHGAYAEGGEVDDDQSQMPAPPPPAPTIDAPAPSAPASSGPVSFVGQWLNSAPADAGPSMPGTATNPSSGGNNPLDFSGGKGKGGGGGGGGGAASMLPMLAALAGGGPVSFVGDFGSSQVGSTGGPSMPATASNPSLGGSNPLAMQSKEKSPAKPDTGKGYGEGTAETNKYATDAYSKTGVTAPPGLSLDAKGGKVKAAAGQKAVKKDNSYSNDKVPALLSEGEIVLPRSVTMHPNAPQKAAEFVHAVMMKKRMGKK